MNTSGQGDEISETSKDDAIAISSTMSENKSLKEDACASSENSVAAAAIDPEDAETSKAIENVVSDLPSSSFDKKPVANAVIATATAEIKENRDIFHESSGLRVDTSCDVGNTGVSPAKAVVKIHQEVGCEESSKPGVLKDIPECSQAESDKEVSSGDDFELHWDTSVDEDDDATEPLRTDDVLEMLNKELGVDAQEKPDTLNIYNEEQTIKSVKDIISHKNEENYVIKTMMANESFKESQKIIAEIDRLSQDVDIDEITKLSAKCKNPVTVDKLVNQLKNNETPKDSVELEEQVVEESKPQPTAIEVSLKPLTKEDEVIVKDDTQDIIEKESNNSFEESQKIIDEIDSLTQEDEINKTTKLSAESDKPITLADSDKKPMDKIDSEKPDIESELNTETVSDEIPFKPLPKNHDEMDVDDSADITQEKKITEANDIFNVDVTASESYEVSQITVPSLDSLTQNKMDKTVKLPIVTVDEFDKPLEVVEIPKDEFIESEKQNTDLDTKTVSIVIPLKPCAQNDKEMDVDKSGENKQVMEIVKVATTASVFENIEILKDDLDESEKPDIEEPETETIAMKVLSEQLSKDEEVMHVDDSNDIIKDTSTDDNCTAEVIQDNTLDSVQKEKVESIKDKEVLPSETVTSEYDIPCTDKTILKEDSMIPFNDEQNKTKTIEHISEISQPFDEKKTESDAINTIQVFDDKLSTVQSLDNKSNNGQGIDDTATSVQDNRKSLDAQNIVHKSSEFQAGLSKDENDDQSLEAQNILLNTETERKLIENASIFDDSLIDTTISPNKHHRINKPDVMLDIPTQDFSDIEAELSESELNDDIEKSEEFTENNEKSDKILNVIRDISGNTTPTIQIDGTTSKLNISITTVSPLAVHQVPSTNVTDEKSSTKAQDILLMNDDENVAEVSLQKVEKPGDDKPSSPRQVDDTQPSGSKHIGDDKLEKLTSDDADDMQESDSLGLLAESSRVMDDDIDDDEEPEELEPDDNDDDEDFDPYEESSSQMLEDLEDTDESNPPTEEKVDETDVIDADEQTDKQTEKQPDKINNILAKVLGSFKDKKPPVTMSGNVLNFVEVEESSDSDDVEEISKPEDKHLISVKVPAEVDVMLTSGAEGGTSAMHSNKDEVVISVPKPHSLKVAKINTSEVTIKSASKNKGYIKIPETTSSEKKSKDEVFNIDSDDEEEKHIEGPIQDDKEVAPAPRTCTKPRKCINPHCTTTSGVYTKASRGTIAYYTLARRSGVACRECTDEANERTQALVDGIKDLRPLMALDMEAPSNLLVEISDSDDEDEPIDESEKIGEKGANFLLDNLVDVLNDVWTKYELDSRLKHTEMYLMEELDLMEADAKEIDKLLDECQMKTDTVRTDFYKDYEPKRKHLGGIVIHDTPFSSYSHTEKDIEAVPEPPSSRYPKRRSASSLSDPPAKKQAISTDTPDKEKQALSDQIKAEEDKDISVVKLSAESAPASLPPHGEILRPPLHAGMSVYAMRNAFGTWNKAKVLEIVQEATPTQPFTQCRVKFEHKVKNSCKVLAGRCLAYSEPCEFRYAIGTRVVALFKDPQSARLDAYYAGVVAEVPNPVNKYRYLVFFDDGYAQYIQHADTRLVCQASALVWEEVHPFIHDFVRNYLKSYPERPMVRLRQGETLNTEWNGKWWSSQVMEVDASIALIHFHLDNRTEWIYRGSTRLEPLYLELQAAKAGGRSRLRLPRTKQIRSNMPLVEYTRSDEQAKADAEAQNTQTEELRRQRAVARKSTTDRQPNQQQNAIQGTPFNGLISRVVYYTPKHVVKPSRMESHTCNPTCDKRADLLPLKELRTYNPLAKPLLSGYERQTARFKGHRQVIYRAPCGRRLRNMDELHRYLRMVESVLSVDLFDFTPGTHCLAEFMLNRCIVGKKDLSHGKENVPVPCVNYYDDSLPEFCSYNTERTPTAGVPLNLDPEFLCGCDCTDDCQDKSKCACWKMTLEGARTIGLEGDNIGYEYRRLPEPLPSGIYECNSRCKCKHTCLNRVAQHPLQLKLQVFKTVNRGWGIRALNDVPKGAFLCVYAGNLLTDATANLDGLNEGDEYLAELDYIEVVEGMKEGYEDDVPDKDKALDKDGVARASASESEPSSESEEEKEKSGKDDDFQPNMYMLSQPQGAVYFEKSLRKREKAKKKEEEKEKQKEQEAAKKRDDCITISDDEEVREPARFTADDIADKDRKHSSRVSVRTLFGKDEACYIMDAKVQGNIGRYLNHSCRPNVFVQNVFVDTHDPRFPWVAFFALTHVRAGNELTWNYNYDFCGGTDREICVAVVKELKLPISADEMENQLTNMTSKMLPQSPLMPGAERLLRHLHDYKVPLALATNSTERTVRLHVAAKPAFFGMFQHKVSVTDPGVLRGKPHPDLYLLAASKFQHKPKPSKCLVFEDSETGVVAAREAGMQVVMIPDIKIDREKTRKATLIIRSLLDFQPELFGLPPFNDTKGDHKINPYANKVPDTELHKPKQLELMDYKNVPNKNILDREARRMTVYESIVERKSIRLSVIDKFVDKSVMQKKIGLDKQPRGISFIDMLERKDIEKGVGNKDERRQSISDEMRSNSIPERLGNRKVSRPEGPYERKSIAFEPLLFHTNPKSVEDQRKRVSNQRQEERKKEEKEQALDTKRKKSKTR